MLSQLLIQNVLVLLDIKKVYKGTNLVILVVIEYLKILGNNFNKLMKLSFVI